MTLMDATATQLATLLTNMSMDHNPKTGAFLSAVCEATLGYQDLSPNLAQAQCDLDHARWLYTLRGELSDERWDDVTAAARRLAGELAKLGEHRIRRCERKGPCGTCNSPLDSDDQCRSTLGHIAESEPARYADIVATTRTTCPSFPLQAEGQLVDGRYFYFRYRCGVASLAIGPTPADVSGRQDVTIRIGDNLDGELTIGKYRAAVEQLYASHHQRH